MSYNQSKFNIEILSAKIQDNIILVNQKQNEVYTSFLYEEEQAVALNILKQAKVDFMFYGGFEDAQRKVLGVFNKNFQSVLDNFPIVPLEFIYKKEYNLSHRDFLGSLMAIGIKREVVGDILIESGRAIVFVKQEMVSYIKTQITKIGRVGVDINTADNSNLPVINNITEKMYTISSLRLDNIVSAVSLESRDKSAKLIKSGFVNVNHITKENVSFNVSQDDIITIKGKGKFVISEIKGLSKKGKIKINIKHYC